MFIGVLFLTATHLPAHDGHRGGPSEVQGGIDCLSVSRPDLSRVIDHLGGTLSVKSLACAQPDRDETW